jgi:CRISPR-associated protein Csd2
MYHEAKLKPGDKNAIPTTRQLMCQKYIDVCMFGAVMSTTGKDGEGKASKKKTKPDKSEDIIAKLPPNLRRDLLEANSSDDTTAKKSRNNNGESSKYNAGTVTGPIQVGFSESIDPVLVIDHCISRKCVTNDEIAEKQINKSGHITGTLGRKATIPYALFRAPIWINPFMAVDTGLTLEKLNLFFKALVLCFGHDRSASRGRLSFRGAYIFIHNNSLGSGAHDYELFESIQIKRNTEKPRRFADYDVEVLSDKIHRSVTLHKILHTEDVDKVFA